MKIWVKHIVFFFALLFSSNYSYSQFYLYNEQPIDVDAEFSRETIESSAKQSFFNALILKNNSTRSETFTLNITVPEGWTVIGGDKLEISLPALDSIVVPLRVAVSGNVRGDIGYSVIASLTDSRGNTIKNVYCFVKIPRETDLKVKFLNRIFYLDPANNSTEFSVILQNKGNREEVINFQFDGNNSLGIGIDEEVLYSNDVSIPPLSDSLFTFRVSLLKTEILGKNMFGLKSKISSIDTTYENNLWFKLLSSSFNNEISSNEIPLSVELFAQGLADPTNKPLYNLFVEGKTFFKSDAELNYYYRNFSSRTPEDFYLYNRMYVRGNLGKWTLEVGDGYRNVESSMIGRGGYLAYNSSNIKADLIATRNVNTDANNFGSTFHIKFSKYLQSNLGLAYNDAKSLNINSKLVYLGSKIVLLKHHIFYFQTSYNKLQRDVNGVRNHNEYSWQMYYTSQVGSVTTLLRARSASELHFSPYGGKQEIFGSVIWRMNEKNQLQLLFNDNSIKNSVFDSTIIISKIASTTREASLSWRYFLMPEVEVYAGPAFGNFKSSGISAFPTNKAFESFIFKGVIGSRIKNATSTIIITPSYEVARVNVIDNPFSLLDSNQSDRTKPYYNHLSLTLRTRHFSAIAYYTAGPRSSFDQINYLYSGKQSRKIQFLPTFDYFIYKDVVKLQLGLSYANDLVAKSIYSTFNGQINCYFPRDFELQLLGVYALQKRLNIQDNIESYQSLYLEVGLKKDFNINQPRVKYHDVELLFFKDFNGNSQQEENEPGIKSILVEIEKIKSDYSGTIPGEFYNAELLSDNTGRVSLDRIPEGLYKINYNSIGKEVGTFSKSLEVNEIKINKSGEYYFPFVEKNKVFGKIVLNRSRLSGLGKMDISNVRVTATDSQGRSHSTLTDKNGEFVLFAPVTDEYILTINNIYYENFDLRQNNFVVHFNGYKQFEVNFVFDEKVRRINFAATPEGEGVAGIQQVRRTNITGTVKDANSQSPIRARVNLVNTRTNSTITSTFSSATTGEYTLSFMAGDNYLLEVVADDYWYLSENLVLNQVTTFMSLNRDVLLKPIAVGSKVELNIRFDINSDFLAPESVAELNRLIRLIKQNVSVKLEIQGHCDDLEGLQKPEVALNRAKKVAEYLIENGFSNVEVKSLGNTVPIAANDTEEGRTSNRRVEVEVISK